MLGRTVAVKDMLHWSLLQSAMEPAIMKAPEPLLCPGKVDQNCKVVHLAARNDKEAAKIDRFRHVLKHHHKKNWQIKL